LQRVEVVKVDGFKYLGSTVKRNGECGREVKKRVQAGRSGWPPPNHLEKSETHERKQRKRENCPCALLQQ